MYHDLADDRRALRGERRGEHHRRETNSGLQTTPHHS